MKIIIILCVAVTSIMLLSFRQVQKIKLLRDGNYLASRPVVMNEQDAKTLFDLTRASASETTVVHQTIWKHTDAASLKVNGVIRTASAAASETTVVHETIWKHKDASALKLNRKEMATVNRIMAKYTR